jgi:hypothetical protein
MDALVFGWKESRSVTALPDYLSEDGAFTVPTRELLLNFGHAVDALMYYHLFFPKFVEVENSVLLNDDIDCVSERFSVQKKTTKLTIDELEASFNFVEVPYMFCPVDVNTDSVIILLCNMLVQSISCRLRYEYPDREFVVSVLSPEESGSVYGVTFSERR